MPVLEEFKELEHREGHNLSRKIYIDGINDYVQKNRVKVDSNISHVKFTMRLKNTGNIDTVALWRMQPDEGLLGLIKEAIDSIGANHTWTFAPRKGGTPDLTMIMGFFLESDHSVSISSFSAIICQTANSNRFYTLSDQDFIYAFAELENLGLRHCINQEGEVFDHMDVRYMKSGKWYQGELTDVSSKKFGKLKEDLHDIETFEVTSFHENGITKTGMVTRMKG